MEEWLEPIFQAGNFVFSLVFAYCLLVAGLQESLIHLVISIVAFFGMYQSDKALTVLRVRQALRSIEEEEEGG